MASIEHDRIMRMVDGEICNHSGKGFKIELADEIIFLFKLERIFNTYEWPSIKRNYIDRRIDYFYEFAWEVSMLPSGITIEKTPIQVEKSRATDLTKYYKKFRKVYLSVSDEYASQVYREKFTDIGLPFRDRLLAKHSDLLRKILEETFNRSHYNYLRVFEDGVNGDEIYRCFFFSQLNMMSLNSVGEIYGMALALVEIIKKDYPRFWDNTITTVHFDTINIVKTFDDIESCHIGRCEDCLISFEYIPREPEPPKNKFQSW